MKTKAWSVYILRCADGSLYTGIAKDVLARLKKHNEGKAAAYTRGRGPLRLLYRQGGLTHSQALKREARIKALPRRAKMMMVTGSRNRRKINKPVQTVGADSIHKFQNSP